METGLRVPPSRGGEGRRMDGERTEDGHEVGESQGLRLEKARTALGEPGPGQGLPQGFGAAGRWGHRLSFSARPCLRASTWRETLASAGSCSAFFFS